MQSAKDKRAAPLLPRLPTVEESIPIRRPPPSFPVSPEPDASMGRLSPPGEPRRPPGSPPAPERRYAYKQGWVRALFRAVDAAGEALSRGPRERPAQLDRVLVMRPDHLGDVVFSFPALWALRERLPEARIDILVSPAARPLLQSDPKRPLWMGILEHQAPWLRRPKGRRFSPTSAWTVAQMLRRRCRELGGVYDLAIDFRGDFHYVLAARLAGVRYLVGRGITGLGFLLDVEGEEVPGRHQVESNLYLIEQAGFGPIETANPELWLSREEREQGRALLAARRVDPERILVGLHPGAGAKTKRWGADRYGRLIERMVRELNVQVLVLGGPEDEEEIQTALAGLRWATAARRVIDLGGRLPDLRAFMAVVRECTLFIGNDSGPSHIASALGVPLLCLFSGTNDPAEWGPRGPAVVILRKRVPCERCGLISCDHHSCMVQLDEEAVYQAVKQCVSG